MGRPWLWNLALFAAVVFTAARLISSLGRPLPPLPARPELTREPLGFSLPPQQPEAEYQDIVSDNLFRPDRGKVVAAPPPPAAPAAPKPVAVPKATLFGVVIEEGGDRYAFLVDTAAKGKGKPKKYREGDSFSGGRITRIKADGVVLTVGSTEHAIALRAPKKGLPAFKPPQPSQPAAATGPERRVATPPVRSPRVSQPDRSRSIRGTRRPVRSPARRTPVPRYNDYRPGERGDLDPEAGYEDGPPFEENDPYYEEDPYSPYAGEEPW